MHASQVFTQNGRWQKVMKNQLLVGFLSIVLLTACGGGGDHNPQSVEQETPNATAELAALVQEYFERNLELNPLSATQMGDDRFDDQLPNSYGQEHIAASDALNEEFLRRLLEIDASGLEGQDWLSYE
jgi:uncharacterized protein (DUF885 family)